MCVCSVAQCATLCNPMNCSPPGSSVHGISQARILEWVTISYSKGFFSTQRLNPPLSRLLHWQGDSLPLCHLGSPSIKSDRKANNVRLEKGVRTSMKRKKVNYIYCSKSHNHKLTSQKCHFPFLYQKRCIPCCLRTFTDFWKHSIQNSKGLYISTFEKRMW